MLRHEIDPAEAPPVATVFGQLLDLRHDEHTPALTCLIITRGSTVADASGHYSNRVAGRVPECAALAPEKPQKRRAGTARRRCLRRASGNASAAPIVNAGVKTDSLRGSVNRKLSPDMTELVGTRTARSSW
jgi:hypothetical protein